jgi:hypothetical protein
MESKEGEHPRGDAGQLVLLGLYGEEYRAYWTRTGKWWPGRRGVRREGDAS